MSCTGNLRPPEQRYAPLRSSLTAIIFAETRRRKPAEAPHGLQPAGTRPTGRRPPASKTPGRTPPTDGVGAGVGVLGGPQSGAAVSGVLGGGFSARRRPPCGSQDIGQRDARAEHDGEGQGQHLQKFAHLP